MIVKFNMSVFMCVCVCFLATAVKPAAGADGKQILNEASVWRTHVTWGTPMQYDGSGLKKAKFRKHMKTSTPPAPKEWMKSEFDDSAWGLWREIHAVETLAGSDVVLYDTKQYGAQQSSSMRRRCLRGKFRVTDPADVKNLTVTVVYRGGVGVFLNGKEVGRGNLSSEALADSMGCAEPYAKEVYYKPDGKPWGLKNMSINGLVFKDEVTLKDFNQRMRKLTVKLPSEALCAGVNVLSLDVRVAPSPVEVGVQGWWNACGVALIDVRADGPMKPAGTRPDGIQVWTANSLFKVSPFGSANMNRVGNGRRVILWSIPLCWKSEADGVGAVRMIGARNGVFSGQVVLSSVEDINGLNVKASDIALTDGSFKIPASACEIGYMTYAAEPPSRLTDVSVSLLDVLYENPPKVVESYPAKPFPGAFDVSSKKTDISWRDGGATLSVWVNVKVPKDAPAGEYTGSITVSAEGLKPVAVPVNLKVHGYVLPDPRDFVPHIGLVHSPESLVWQYNVKPWSDEHFVLIEKTLQKMGELGGNTLFIPLINKTWLGNTQTLVRLVKKGDGFTYDFSIFDRYLDLFCKYMNPKAICLYTFSPSRKTCGSAVLTTIDDGKLGTFNAPDYAPTPEAIAFWKPLITEVRSRLKQRGLDGSVSIGMTLEGGRMGAKVKPIVALFKAVWPEMKMADLAHFGGQLGKACDVPMGYTMSVWGNESRTPTKKWGAFDLPFILLRHFRADPVIDMRPTSSRGALYLAAETAMSQTFWGRGGPSKRAKGLGPLGMDFWNFPADGKVLRYPGTLEGRVSNLSMTHSTSAFLAPGPDGPLPTARFDVFREGIQVCEARALLERSLIHGNLDAALTKRCQDIVKARIDALYTLG